MATVVVKLDNQPFFLETADGEAPILYSAYDMRRFASTLFAGTGIIGHNSFLVTQAPAIGWRVNVNTGYARVGNYLVHNGSDQIVSLADFATAPTATRTHKVWIAVYDKASSGSEYAAKLVVTEDTGTGAPLPNATAYIQLAQVKISPGQSNIQKANINLTYHHASPYVDPIACDPSSGIADTSGNLPLAPFSVREAHGIVRFSGGVKRTNGSPFNGGTAYQITTVTGTLWPKYTRYATAMVSIDTGTGYGAMYCRLTIDPDGSVTAYIPESTKPSYILVDGATYELD